MQSEAEVSKEFLVVIVGWNGFTDCSTMSLKAFNLRPYFAANHNGGHLISCSVPSAVISDFVYKKCSLWSRLGSIDNQCFMDTAFQIAQQRFYKKWSDRMYCTAIFYIVLLIWSVLYFNYWFTYSLKGFFALCPLHEDRSVWSKHFQQFTAVCLFSPLPEIECWV